MVMFFYFEKRTKLSYTIPIRTSPKITGFKKLNRKGRKKCKKAIIIDNAYLAGIMYQVRS